MRTREEILVRLTLLVVRAYYLSYTPLPSSLLIVWTHVTDVVTYITFAHARPPYVFGRSENAYAGWTTVTCVAGFSWSRNCACSSSSSWLT